MVVRHERSHDAARLAATLARIDEIKKDVPTGMSLPDLALRFILASPDVTTVIPGMRRALPRVSGSG